MDSIHPAKGHNVATHFSRLTRSRDWAKHYILGGERVAWRGELFSFFLSHVGVFRTKGDVFWAAFVGFAILV